MRGHVLTKVYITNQKVSLDSLSMRMLRSVFVFQFTIAANRKHHIDVCIRIRKIVKQGHITTVFPAWLFHLRGFEPLSLLLLQRAVRTSSCSVQALVQDAF